ncbi:MAG: hypothetical protein EOO14_18465 [Chitinophagaceae bacterium]|nr:MAG: hypothetical protein EOO14_18465 [Chitinophagaceae bacterium]
MKFLNVYCAFRKAEVYISLDKIVLVQKVDDESSLLQLLGEKDPVFIILLPIHSYQNTNKPYTMKQLLLYILLMTAFLSNGQTVFFTSQQSFPNKASAFYSSLAQNDSLLLFNAKDYKLYAYEKATGRQLWVYNLGWQSNVAPFFAGTSVWANTANGASVQLDLKGKEVKSFPFSIETQPVLKSNTLYTTGIYDGGCLIAYNLAADSIAWKRFLAHGCSRQPYYFGDKIIANAEGNHWLEMTYDGRLKNSACETEEHSYPHPWQQAAQTGSNHADRSIR